VARLVPNVASHCWHAGTLPARSHPAVRQRGQSRKQFQITTAVSRDFAHPIVTRTAAKRVSLQLINGQLPYRLVRSREFLHDNEMSQAP